MMFNSDQTSNTLRLKVANVIFCKNECPCAAAVQKILRIFFAFFFSAEVNIYKLLMFLIMYHCEWLTCIICTIYYMLLVTWSVGFITRKHLKFLCATFLRYLILGARYLGFTGAHADLQCLVVEVQVCAAFETRLVILKNCHYQIWIPCILYYHFCTSWILTMSGWINIENHSSECGSASIVFTDFLNLLFTNFWNIS